MMVIIQLADPSLTGRFVHATSREPSASNPEQGLLVFKVDQDEVESLLQQLAASGVCEFKVLFPTAHMNPNPCRYIVEIKQPGQETRFFQHGQGIIETDSAKATLFGTYYDALQLVTDFLNPTKIALTDPVTITIRPAPSNEAWTIDEILEREG